MKRQFTSHHAGQLGILSPMAGLTNPEKPSLHRQVYRSMELVQRLTKQPIPFYCVSTYPQLRRSYHYLWPLLLKHAFVAQGPFQLPVGDYEQAQEIVATRLDHLRQAAQFPVPDYDRMSRK